MALGDARRRYAGHGIAAPGANTSIFTAITPAKDTTFLLVGVALAVSSVVNIYATDGTTPYTWGLNGSNAIPAGDLYWFPVLCNPALSYTVRVETDGIIQQLLVYELVGA